MKKVTFTPSNNRTPLQSALSVLCFEAEESQDFDIIDSQIVELDLTEENDPIYWSVVESDEDCVILDC